MFRNRYLGIFGLGLAIVILAIAATFACFGQGFRNPALVERTKSAPAAAAPGITIVTNSIGGSGDANTYTTTAIDTTGCNLLIAMIAGVGATYPALTDSAGNTWSGAVSNTSTANGRMMYCYNPTKSSTHTFTAAANGSYPVVTIVAATNVASSPLDQTSSAAISDVYPKAGSITPSQSGTLIICGVAASVGNVTSIDSGLGAAVYASGTSAYGALATNVQSSAAAINPTWTLTDIAAGVVLISNYK